MKKLKVDFHTHILPGIDDGSLSVEETIKMLRMQKDNGIEIVVATPHFYADSDTDITFLRRRDEALKIVNELIEKVDGLPKIIPGAEVLYFDGIENWDILPKLSIKGTNYILIEMPTAPFSKRSIEALSLFREKTGLTPIIAHIDRYISAFKTYSLPDILSQMDVLVQMNADFFLRFPNSLQALKLLKAEKIHLLGSDCHNTMERKPNLSSAQKVIFDKIGCSAINRLIKFENLVIGKQSL